MSIDNPGSLTSLERPDGQPVRKSMQRLRWFISTFEKHLDSVAASSDVHYKTDNRTLTRCFLNWIRRFEKLKPNNPDHRLPFVGFISGQMLKELIELSPVAVESTPDDADESLPEYYWPEGYVYVTYCLKIRRAVIESDFDSHFEYSESIKDINLWWTFRENTLEFSDYAIPYLDKFSGEEPEWELPATFDGKSRLARLRNPNIKIG